MGLRRVVLVAAALCMASSWSAGPARAEGDDQPLGARAVATVLDRFHEAAARADGETYFSLFAEGAVFIGTDAAERWTVADFRVYAEPHFSKGQGWTYVPGERHIYMAPGGNVAWFDEILGNEKYGTSRGTGVLVRTAAGWRIAQYHLTFPIPNDLAAELTARIKAFETR